jgi:phage terminase large subunit-like protein
MISALKNNCEKIIQNRKIVSATSLLDADYTHFDNPLFCEYQKLIVTDDHPVSIVEKGRQIGYSHITAFRAVLKASSNKRDTVYMSYNRESAKDFMRDVQRWCRIFNLTFSLYQEECIDNNSINIFECSFLNLRKIIAVSGDCTNLRGKPGADIIIDEACYNPNPIEDILAASMATLIHGGSVRIGSTHAGIDSDFNKLIERVKAGELPYKHIKVTFKDAVNQGLFKRICARKKEIWSQEKENLWIEEIYKMYGNRASEELDAIPSDYSQGGKIFKDFKFIDTSNLNTWDYIEFRYHDLAASEDNDEKNDSIYYSASVKVRYVIQTQKMVVVDWTAERLSPLEGDARIEQLALMDGSKSVQLIELEPGSTGEKYVAIMQDRLVRKGIYQVFGYRPKIDKVKRAIPAGNAMCAGDLLIEENMQGRDEFTRLITRFSSKKQPLVTDLGDCISGIYDYVSNEYNWILSSAG